MLVDAIEAADEGVVGEGNARGVDGEGVILCEDLVQSAEMDGWMDGWVEDGVGMGLPFLLRRLGL